MDQPLSIVIILGVMAQGQGLANNAGWYTRRKPLPIVRGQHRLSFPSMGTHCCSLSGTETLAVLLPVTQLLCKWSLAKKLFCFFLAWLVMVSHWGVGGKKAFSTVFEPVLVAHRKQTGPEWCTDKLSGKHWLETLLSFCTVSV